MAKLRPHPEVFEAHLADIRACTLSRRMHRPPAASRILLDGKFAPGAAIAADVQGDHLVITKV